MHPFQLSELTYLTARLVGGNVLQEAYATAAGSTTELTDTYRPSNEAADYWNEGTIWIIKTTDGLAPQWESSIIRDYDGAGVFTFDALTVAVTANDKYAVCKRRYQRHILRQFVNQAIQELGAVARTDTSLTTIDEQTEYTLPIGANPDLRQVHIQTKKDDSNDNKWVKIFGWEVIHGDPSTGDTLRLPRQYTAGYSIRLDYNDRHDQLFDASDRLQEDIPVERVIYPAALYSLKWYRDKTRTDDFRDSIREMARLVEDFASTRSIPMHSKGNKILQAQ
jgi:hypothetical protein